MTPIGHEIGLISDERYAKFLKKLKLIADEKKRTEKTVFSPSDALNNILVSRETSKATTGVRLCDLLKRPQIGYDCLTSIDVMKFLSRSKLIQNMRAISNVSRLRLMKCTVLKFRLFPMK